MRYDLTHVKMAIIKKKKPKKKQEILSGGEEMKKKEPLYTLWECKLVQPLWKTLWEILKEN